MVAKSGCGRCEDSVFQCCCISQSSARHRINRGTGDAVGRIGDSEVLWEQGRVVVTIQVNGITAALYMSEMVTIETNHHFQGLHSYFLSSNSFSR